MSREQIMYAWVAYTILFKLMELHKDVIRLRGLSNYKIRLQNIEIISI